MKPDTPIDRDKLIAAAEEVDLDLDDPDNLEWIEEHAIRGFSAATFEVLRRISIKEAESQGQE